VNLSAPFIHRPVATTLLTLAVALGGIIGFRLLPVAPLPQVDFPTIQVSAGVPGASPQTMASSVATPLERQFGRIAGITEMTSVSSLGSANITLQFDLNRNIDAAARDVQAAINAAKAYLPANLPMNPRYRKVNPADSPILILALTSDIYDRPALYDAASSILQQKLSQVSGVGQVGVWGSSLPAVRVELNPHVVNKYGIGLNQIATVLANANANTPKGEIANGRTAWNIRTTDQLFKADQYMPLVVIWQNGAPVRLDTLGRVVDSVEDLRNAGLSNGKPAVLIAVFRQPEANIIDTVDRVMAEFPELHASIPPAMRLNVMMDRTTTIRASIHDVEVTLLISIALVVLVVFIFLRNGWATFIPSVAVPVSLIGTFGVMYLVGYSLDNLSLMALTICTGFVVDDAIVVIENITRYIEMGMRPMEAALRGSREIGFTVLSMSTSLVAVFIPILMMGGIVGRLFREFAVTLSVAIGISLLVSLTTTPMMCGHLLKHQPPEGHGRLYRISEKFFEWILNTYAAILRVVLRHPAVTLLIVFGTVALNVYLFTIVPKGFFPSEDTGRMMGVVQGEQNISFQAMQKKMAFFLKAVLADPAVDSAASFTGGGGTNTGRMFVALKDLSVRKVSVDQVINRLRRKTAGVPGAQLFLQPVQDIRVGGRMSNALYQFTLQTQDLGLLDEWSPRVLDALRKVPILADVNTDQQNNGLMAYVDVDRDTASRLGLSAQQVDQALYSAFGQRQVSTMYTQLNQYHVVMEVAPEYWQDPETLKDIYVQATPPGSGTRSSTVATRGVLTTPARISAPAGISAAPTATSAVANSVSSTPTPGSNSGAGGTPTVGLSSPAGTASIPGSGSPPSTGATGVAANGSGAPAAVLNTNGTVEVPLSAFTRFAPSNTPMQVNHQGQFPSVTISFNLRPGVSLGEAVDAITSAEERIGMPAAIQGNFAGTAQAFQASLANEPVLILTALIAVYIVLGMLYESYIHPITILSTLPSAGVGALLALLALHYELTVIAIIGIILLIGIVKKNAIMMIDFALDAERSEGKNSRDAIYEACILRFRPITMTTFAALLGALPLAVGTGMGSELRRPLGIAIVGGLIVSQMLTLFTTPVVYLYMDRMRLFFSRRQHGRPIETLPTVAESTD